MNQDSLKKRFAYKFVSSLIGFLIGIVTTMIPVRALSTMDYGKFTFLTEFFKPVLPFFTFNSGYAYFTKLSKRPEEKSIIRFYLIFLLGCFALIFTSIAIIFYFNIENKLWADHESILIYSGALFSILFFFSGTFSIPTADAFGLTVKIAKLRIFQKIFSVIYLGALFVLNVLTLKVYFIYSMSMATIFIIGVFIILAKEDVFNVTKSWKINKLELKKYIHEFYQYSHPLFTFSLANIAFGLTMTWLFQTYAGSLQFGYFGLSTKIAMICFLFTGSMTGLLTRDFSIHWHKGDTREAAILLKTYLPMFYLLTAIISVFVSTHSKIITSILGGAAYDDAYLAVLIMSFMPLHQTYGQLVGSAFYATDKTRLYRNLRLIFPFMGFPVTFIMISNVDHLGLNLGAAGYAFAGVFNQIVRVNIMLFYMCKILDIKMKPFLYHQLYSVTIVYAIAISVKILVAKIPLLTINIYTNILSDGIMYMIMIGLILYNIPWLMGVSKERVQSMVKQIIEKVYAR
jgi:O-antigen/teichoic acid export membrane protein